MLAEQRQLKSANELASAAADNRPDTGKHSHAKMGGIAFSKHSNFEEHKLQRFWAVGGFSI